MKPRDIFIALFMGLFMAMSTAGILFTVKAISATPPPPELPQKEVIQEVKYVSDTSKNLILEKVPGSVIIPLDMVTEYEIKLIKAVDLKSRKDSSSPTITAIPSGVSLKRESFTDDGWVRVNYLGKTGFINTNEEDMVIIPVVWTKDSAFAKINRANANKDVGVKAIEFALLQLTKPYEWGAEGSFNYDFDKDEREGFDCSGLTQWAYWMSGAKIPRTTMGGYEKGTEISRENIQIGDLIYFITVESENPVTHVGMYMGDNMMIHATQQFMMTTISEVYWEKMVTIRRH